MKRVIVWIQERTKYMKVVFVVTVLLFVGLKFVEIMKQFKGDRFQEILTMMPPVFFILILVVGSLSILPMIAYDFFLQRLLQNKYQKFYVFETSWLINTLNNMIGFGGVFSLGLRSQFYGRDKDPKEVLNGTTKIFLFTMSGLSVYSLLVLILVFFDHENSFLQNYWLTLLGGALYFPLIFFITARKKEGILGGLSSKMRFSLLSISFFEWTGVGVTFLITGKLLGVHLSVFEIILLFIVSMVIGIVSMIPGGLGTFDLTMVNGLRLLGISEELALAWILLYRVAYYFVPFLIGLIVFVRHMGARFNKRFDDMPKELMVELAHKGLGFLLYFSGILLVLSATIPEAFSSLRWLQRISPWSEQFVAQSPKIILGFLMLASGRAIFEHVKRAYFATLSLFFVLFFYVWFQGHSWISNVFIIVMILLLNISKSELYREQLVISLENQFKDGLVIIGLVLLYLVVGAWNWVPKIHKLKHVPGFFLFPSEKLWMSGFFAVTFVVLAMLIYFKYLEGSKQKVGLSFIASVEKRVTYVLFHYGGNTESQLVYLKDKKIFFFTDENGEDTAFLQFSYFRDKAVVMGSPSGKVSDFSKLIKNFIEECDLLGYSPVFYEVTEEVTLILHEFGYSMIKMGEEGHVYLPNFSISGKKQRGNRATMNRMKKEEVHLEILQPPFHKSDLKRCREISEEWLGSRRERGFSMGFFSEDYIKRAPLAVVKDANDKIIAFANVMPTYTEKMVSIDLMRYTKDAPQSVMDFLFISLFNHYKGEGIEIFNLGMAPLSNVGVSRKSFVQERIANLVYQFGSYFYAFQGVREYKNKYASHWRSRYTMYSRDDMILFVVWALMRVGNRKVKS